MDAGKRVWRSILALTLCGAALISVCGAAPQPAELPSDVPSGAWYAQYVQTCIDKNLMGIFEGGQFRPEQELSVADLIVLTAQLWRKTSSEAEGEEIRDDDRWIAPISDAWNVESEIPLEESGMDFACYTDALEYVNAEDHGYMSQIEQRIRDTGASVSSISATREDLCILLGGNMSAPVYRRNGEYMDELSDLCIRNMYMTGIMVGTGAGLELGRPLTRKEAAAFLARYACPELRMPDEDICPGQKESLAQIEIYLAGFGIRFEEYKLDVAERKLWGYEYKEPSDEETYDRASAWPIRNGRDPNADNEGYQTCRELSQAQITEFIDSASLETALTWGHYYNQAYAFDGLQWGITFTFSDDSEWKIQGSNAFPDGWLPFWNAIYGMAGKVPQPWDTVSGQKRRPSG